MVDRPVGMILSAGFGTRLYPLSSVRPKPTMEIFGKPIIYILIRMLEKAGIDEIIVNLYHQPEHIRRIVHENNFRARIHLITEPEILGTAGGIANAVSSLKIMQRSMVVIHGDIICDFDLNKLIQTTGFCTLVCAQDQTVDGYEGGVNVDENNNIIDLGPFFRSKRPIAKGGFFTGIHFLSAEAVHLVSKSAEKNLVAELYPRWLKEGRAIKGYVTPLTYDDLGSPSRIFNVNMQMVKGWRFNHFEILEDLTEISPNVFAGEKVKIDFSASIIPPAVIDDDVTIESRAEIGPNVIIGKASKIKEGAVIKNSVIMSETEIEKDEKLDCAIGLKSVRVLVKS